MFNYKYLQTLINYLFFLLISSISIVSAVHAKPKQQNIFLDASGKPIPNDVLIFLSTAPKKSVIPQKTENTIKKNPHKNRNSKKKIAEQKLALEKELLQAMKAGKIERVNQLLRAKVSPTYKNIDGDTPLRIAVSRGWASMVINLLENGANINEKGVHGINLLHIASSRGLTDVAKVLVNNGLNPNKTTDKHWTPLHIAARYGYWKLVQFYIQVGVDPNIRNSDGKTAFDLARHLRHMGVTKMLSQVTTVRSFKFNKRRKRRS